jgi:hypothetical protein
MKEHRIRLRAGWVGECHDANDGKALRVSLPNSVELAVGGRWRLTRSFGKPKLGAGETVWLELKKVSGLGSALLNGVLLPGAEDGRLAYQIDPGLLAERNLLVLEMDGRRGAAADDREWGEVSLVIRVFEELAGAG